MTVGIVGLGLIGGSVGLALRDPNRTILGYDPDGEAQKTAKSRFCADELVSLNEVSQAEIVFICAPPDAVIPLLELIKIARADHTIVTDCSSVKRSVSDWAIQGKANWFVPGHPMAGHEKNSAKFASAWLFRDARWLLTPNPKTDRKAIKSVEEAVKLMGAKPIRIDADDHDRHVAVLSHLPHLVANALEAIAEPLEHREIAAGSWKDLTRVAGADPGLWAQILNGNAAAVAEAIDSLIAELESTKQTLVSKENLKSALELARKRKEK